MLFEKDHLHLRYDWIDDHQFPNGAITGFPDNIALNKYDGYAVLHFLSRYADSRGWRDISRIDRLERALRDMPLIRKSHHAVKNWLDENLPE